MVSDTLQLCSESTRKVFLRVFKRPFELGLSDDALRNNFQLACTFIQKKRFQLKIPADEKIIFNFQHDESPIDSSLSVVFRNNKINIVGCCGEGPAASHKCGQMGQSAYIEVESIEDIFKAVQMQIKATSISLVLIKALREDIPAIPVVAFGTCCRIGLDEMRAIWERVQTLFVARLRQQCV